MFGGFQVGVFQPCFQQVSQGAARYTAGILHALHVGRRYEKHREDVEKALEVVAEQGTQDQQDRAQAAQEAIARADVRLSQQLAEMTKREQRNAARVELDRQRRAYAWALEVARQIEDDDEAARILLLH